MADEAGLRRYLLGELDGDALDRVELSLLEDPGAAQALAGAQDELIEDYLSDVLAPAERARFEHHFLASAEHRRSFEGARLLRQAVSGWSQAPPSSVAAPVRWALAVAAGVVFLAVAAGLVRRQPPQQAVTSASVTPQTRPEVSAEAPSPTEPPASPERRQVASLTLAPGRQMAAGGAPVVQLGPGTGVLRVSLIIEDPGLRVCTAALSTPERGELWRRSGLRPSRTSEGTILALEIPTDGLAPGPDYRITLAAEPSGTRSGSYYFRIAAP